VSAADCLVRDAVRRELRSTCDFPAKQGICREFARFAVVSVQFQGSGAAVFCGPCAAIPW